MIVGRWTTRALGELLPYDNDVIVFLPDGTGWIFVMNKRSWYTDTFIWGKNANGSLYIEGKIHEYMKEEAKASKIFIQEVFYKSDEAASGRIITFSSSLSSGHFLFGLDDDDVPDLVKEMTEVERIQERIKFLHWYTPSSIVEHVSKELVEMDNQYLSFLLQPLGKEYWDNAALVLTKIDQTRIEPLIPGLIEWMYDKLARSYECCRVIM